MNKTKIFFNNTAGKLMKKLSRIEYLLHGTCNQEVHITSILIDASIEQFLTSVHLTQN